GHLEAVGCLREAPAGKSLLDGFGKPMPASRPHHPNPETRTRQSPGRRWDGKNRGHVGERARSRLLSGKDGAVMDMETLHKLNELKLLGMADKLRELSEGKEIRELAPGDVVAQLVDCEYERRRKNRVSALLKAAQIRIPSACLEDIEYSIARNLRKETIRELSSCEFIDKHTSVLISGACGTGKSYLACALANLACRNGYSAWYFRVSRLLEYVAAEKKMGNYLKALEKLGKVKLLILDDLGSNVLTAEQRQIFFEVIEE